MAEEWRLIVSGPGDGAWNMAVDRSLQESRDSGQAPPTLRLYRWARPTITLGRFQSLEDVDLERCRDLGVDVVRRPTGGKGVLHADEITYSCVAHLRDGVPPGVTASYRFLCSAIVAAYLRLGLSASLVAKDRRAGGGGACYLRTTRADVAFGAAKLSGSAQVWLHDTVLQHGSFVLSRNSALEASLFHLSERERDALSEETATLESAGVKVPDEEAIIAAITAGWEEALSIRLARSELLEEEHASAERLVYRYKLDVPG